MQENNTIYIGLGTNLGDRNQNLELAIEEIRQFASIKKRSSVYETKPWGYKNQNDFLNMVIEIQSDLEPINLLARLQEIEHKMGRTREIKNGPRIIDLDILLYNDQTIHTDTLKIPHPRMNKRDFVLKPLKEILPTYEPK